MLPHFETDRLWLRPRSMDDLGACLAMDRDPEVTRFIPGPWHDPQAHEAFLRERIETSFGEGLGYWSIFPKAQPERFAGWILLIPYDGIGPEVEIGWRLNRAAWGNGFAPEAARPVAAHAVHTLGLERIVADIDPDNHASLRVAEKVGMTFEGDGLHGGRPCKRYVLTIVASQGVA
ncbi:GNAT family N-acetyltransferase [Sinisalibacter aestuarii]|uniref:GNAT family N-acetyltransferase n=1 Tax=Sinisalibacter aestuarii TaxID=2949426 RepID=UPI0024909389|nr:GNAT family N-acetyltransferase [Sinisalibacter aestuarii]